MIKEFVEPFTEVTDRLGRWYNLRKSVETQLRLLYLECRKNLELLQTIELDHHENDAHTDDPDYLEMAMLLEVPVLQMVFLDSKNNRKLYELLRKLSLIIETHQDHPHQKKSDKKEKKYNAIQACVYLYLKTATLQKLAQLKKQGKGMQKIYYRARLKNIYSNLNKLARTLENHREIKEILGSS